MRPKTCSECGRKLRYYRGAGRPRFTCSSSCSTARSARLRREERAADVRKLEAAEYSAELHAWMRGELPDTPGESWCVTDGAGSPRSGRR